MAGSSPALTAPTFQLEHIPEKLTDFSDQNMLQPIDLERILIDRVIPPDRNTL
jgi:hypothetical protein